MDLNHTLRPTLLPSASLPQLTVLFMTGNYFFLLLGDIRYRTYKQMYRARMSGGKDKR